MTAARCEDCCESWPPTYTLCPTCGDKTKVFSNIAPEYTVEESESIRKHREFEEYYERTRGNG